MENQNLFNSKSALHFHSILYRHCNQFYRYNEWKRETEKKAVVCMAEKTKLNEHWKRELELTCIQTYWKWCMSKYRYGFVIYINPHVCVFSQCTNKFTSLMKYVYYDRWCFEKKGKKQTNGQTIKQPHRLSVESERETKFHKNDRKNIRKMQRPENVLWRKSVIRWVLATHKLSINRDWSVWFDGEKTFTRIDTKNKNGNKTKQTNSERKMITRTWKTSDKIQKQQCQTIMRWWHRVVQMNFSHVWWWRHQHTMACAYRIKMFQFSMRQPKRINPFSVYTNVCVFLFFCHAQAIYASFILFVWPRFLAIYDSVWEFIVSQFICAPGLNAGWWCNLCSADTTAT